MSKISLFIFLVIAFCGLQQLARAGTLCEQNRILLNCADPVSKLTAVIFQDTGDPCTSESSNQDAHAIATDISQNSFNLLCLFSSGWHCRYHFADDDLVVDVTLDTTPAANSANYEISSSNIYTGPHKRTYNLLCN